MSGDAVLDRYSEAARAREETLCCPVDYDAGLLKLLPQEIVDKDYGCGDPSRYVREGDVVLDLGSGGGKICYMAAQLVGAAGQVIGVDMNDGMLALARKYQAEMAQKLGGERVRFLKGYIQDLALDLEAMEDWLAAHPVSGAGDYARLLDWQQRQRAERPLIADASVDLVISNCVLNLVQDAQKAQLISEIFRVLKPGGRVAISDIVSDRVSPAALKADPELWSGCISGAFQEQAFLQAFLDAGFVAVAYDKWDAAPWRVVEGIEFRSVTLTAVKPEPAVAADRGHLVIYRGPLAEVRDEAGRVYPRGERVAVSETLFRLLTGGAYGDAFIAVPPAAERPVVEDSTGCCGGGSCC
ncbi:methyltransferase domain-containing protein [Thiohalobacter sp. IOR34]|uniref:methyltransferase domain-containing protein n=1 Tax=Thiohalobacter sp. IOR34 TaxID=3057176 RepID=UPI0025B087D6|nr:methyltransferase domain-containing protein [Thiohalobacter sp. IOR34]WJW76509.1 methyltransferase domain-containing protein [Thiohalobacter sp. IOR34]